MTNYGVLADKLISQRSDARPAQAPPVDRGSDANQVYEHVKVLIDHEFEKANIELRRRQLATIERLFLPSYEGRLCLTFGPLLCMVDLQESKGQITAAILGPPNGIELSRRDFPFGDGYNPERVAVEVVSGLIVGEFS